MPIEVQRRGNVALLTIRAADLARAGSTNRIVAKTRRHVWSVGRAPGTDRPAVTMPATVLHVDGFAMVTARLTEHRGTCRLHVMRWTA